MMGARLRGFAGGATDCWTGSLAGAELTVLASRARQFEGHGNHDKYLETDRQRGHVLLQIDICPRRSTCQPNGGSKRAWHRSWPAPPSPRCSSIRCLIPLSPRWNPLAGALPPIRFIYPDGWINEEAWKITGNFQFKHTAAAASFRGPEEPNSRKNRGRPSIFKMPTSRNEMQPQSISWRWRGDLCFFFFSCNPFSVVTIACRHELTIAMRFACFDRNAGALTRKNLATPLSQLDGLFALSLDKGTRQFANIVTPI